MKHSNPPFLVKVAGFMMATSILSLFFLWYSYVWGIGKQINYWQWLGVAAVWIFVHLGSEELQKLTKWPMALLFLSTAIAQVLIWMGVINTPIF